MRSDSDADVLKGLESILSGYLNGEFSESQATEDLAEQFRKLARAARTPPTDKDSWSRLEEQADKLGRLEEGHSQAAIERARGVLINAVRIAQAEDLRGTA